MKSLSSKTILEHHRLLHAMLQNAVYWQILPYNPAEELSHQNTKDLKLNTMMMFNVNNY